MKSRAKTAQSGRAEQRTPKSIRPAAATPTAFSPAPGKSVPLPARKSVAPQARKTKIPPSAAGVRSRPAKKAQPADAGGKRTLGMRGAAPWAARHAAKHAEEAAARNLSPPKPGSARGTLRTPDDADGIKQRISDLHHVLARIRSLQKNLDDGFYQLGVELTHIHEDRLYEAKGFSSFEAFAERELDLGKATALKLSRVPSIFLEAAARRYGFSAALAAIDALDEHQSAALQRKAATSRPNLPLKPPR
jgi:hypothetical protein